MRSEHASISAQDHETFILLASLDRGSTCGSEVNLLVDQPLKLGVVSKTSMTNNI